MNRLIVSAGDAVIDFMPQNEPGVYKRSFGGAPANVCVAAARMGASAAFCGMVGDDMFGRYLSDTLQENNVDVSGLRFTDKATTTMTFVAHNEHGDRDFVFVRKPGADMLYTAADIDEGLIRGAGVLHFCSGMLSCEELRRTMERLIRLASEANALISFDVNYREPHWRNNENMFEVISEFIGYSDILKLSEEEALQFSRGDTLEAAAGYFLKRDQLTIITLGERGALCLHKGRAVRCGGFRVKAEDTTGAGDAFCGVFLAQLMNSDADFSILEMERLTKMIARSNAAAALVAGKKGAISAMPGKDELEAFLRSREEPVIEEMSL